jgi:restriction system protein
MPRDGGYNCDDSDRVSGLEHDSAAAECACRSVLPPTNHANRVAESIPGIKAILLPTLQAVARGMDARVQSMVGYCAQRLGLVPAQLRVRAANGRPTFAARVYWALTQLKSARLVVNSGRGIWNVTESGRWLLASEPAEVNVCAMKRSPEPTAIDVEAAQLLRQLEGTTPVEFESILMKLLARMGYGRHHPGSATLTSRTHDRGVDIRIRQDWLGFNEICVQAKRWKAQNVGRVDIQSFVGALTGERVTKGIVITTSGFTKGAREYARLLRDIHLILIDGLMLARLMLNVGHETYL